MEGGRSKHVVVCLLLPMLSDTISIRSSSQPVAITLSMGAATSSPKESPSLLSSSLLTFPLIEEEEEKKEQKDDQPQDQQEDDATNINDASIKITRAAKLYAFCAALNSCNLGYDIGVNTGAGMLLQNSLELSDVQLEAFFGSLNLFAMVGALCSHTVNDKFGRRWSFRLAAMIFILGTILQSAAYNYVMLMIGRAFVGLGLGFGLAVDPLYIAEISPPECRGRLVNWSEFGINLGIVFGFASGLMFATVEEDVAWRLMFSLGAILPCFVIYFATFVMPESPRWLVANDRVREACEVLKKVYPDGSDVGMIVTEIKDSIEKERIAADAVGWGVILFPTPAFKRLLMVGIGISIAQQAVGIDAITLFLVFVLKESGIHSRMTQMWILLCFGVIVLGTLFLAGCLLDRTGRRPLVFISLLGMSISSFIVAMSFIGAVSSEVGAIIGLGLYQAFFSIGMGPATWTIASEVFPTSIRAKAMSLATFGNRATATIFASSFLSVATAMTWSGFFIMMSVVCLVILLWVHVYVPETKGLSLEEMAHYFAEITGDESILKVEGTCTQEEEILP